MKLTICGIRGSYPVFGKEYEKYGGSTSCYLIETSTQAVIVDAGTGIINVPEMKQQNIPILMTHSHVDHLIGLMAFNGLKDAHRNIDIYLAKRDGLSPHEVTFWSQSTLSPFAVTVLPLLYPPASQSVL